MGAIAPDGHPSRQRCRDCAEPAACAPSEAAGLRTRHARPADARRLRLVRVRGGGRRCRRDVEPPAAWRVRCVAWHRGRTACSAGAGALGQRWSASRPTQIRGSQIGGEEAIAQRARHRNELDVADFTLADGLSVSVAREGGHGERGPSLARCTGSGPLRNGPRSSTNAASRPPAPGRGVPQLSGGRVATLAAFQSTCRSWTSSRLRRPLRATRGVDIADIERDPSSTRSASSRAGMPTSRRPEAGAAPDLYAWHAWVSVHGGAGPRAVKSGASSATCWALQPPATGGLRRMVRMAQDFSSLPLIDGRATSAPPRRVPRRRYTEARVAPIRAALERREGSAISSQYAARGRAGRCRRG